MVIEILEMRGDPGAVEGEGDPSRLAGADGETGRQGCGGSPVVKVAVDDILQLGVPPEPNLDIPVRSWMASTEAREASASETAQ